MTDTTVSPHHHSDAFARNAVLLGYGLLFVAIGLAGVTAVMAVVLAYALRDTVSPMFADHFRFQIRIFWFTLALNVVALLLAATGLGILVCDIIGWRGGWGGWDLSRELLDQLRDFRYGSFALTLITSAAVMITLAALSLVCAPIYGFIRLATAHAIGQTPAS